jgi:hypothetical protein
LGHRMESNSDQIQNKGIHSRGVDRGKGVHVRKLSKLSVSYSTLVCYRTLSRFSYALHAACSLVPAALLKPYTYRLYALVTFNFALWVGVKVKPRFVDAKAVTILRAHAHCTHSHTHQTHASTPQEPHRTHSRGDHRPTSQLRASHRHRRQGTHHYCNASHHLTAA